MKRQSPSLGILYVFLVIVAVLVTATVGLVLVNSGIARKELAAGSEFLEVRTAVFRALIMSRSDSGISARCWLYDQDGYEIAVFERFWTGSDLNLEVIILTVNGRKLVFPAWLETAAVGSARGTGLFSYYDRGGFPAIYERTGLPSGLRSALTALFGAVRKADNKAGTKVPASSLLRLPGGFGTATRQSFQLSKAEVGAVYALTFTEDASLAFRRE